MTELIIIGGVGLVLYSLVSAWQMARLERQIALLWRSDTLQDSLLNGITDAALAQADELAKHEAAIKQLQED